MEGVRAVVLAAGRGIRMGGTAPKTLLPIGDHDALLHYILRGLNKAGLNDLLIVTGFDPTAVQDFATERWAKGNLVFVRNARYASWGNFHSVRLAIDQSAGLTLLVVNSDIVVHPDVYTRALRSDGDLVLAVERRGDLDTEDMRVRIEGDRVLGVSKDLDPKQGHGEFAGVSVIRPDAADRYARLATGAEWQSRTHIYYEDLYNELLAQVDARVIPVERGEYAEVDRPDDLRAAEDVIEAHRDAWEERSTAGTSAG